MSPVLAAVGGKAMWYLTRGSGVVALLLLTASLVLGVLTAGRWEARRWPRFVVEGLHRNISLVVLVFLAIHVVTTVVDGFVPIGWIDVVLPFHAGYRPVWVGLGAVAVDLLAAVVVTSLLRVRIGHRAWRYVHLLSYACWPIALVHGLATGTDATQRWMVALDVACVAAVLGVVWWRIAVRRPAHPVAAPLALAVSGILPIALALFAWTGPLRSGWGSHGGRLGAPATTAATAQVPLPLDAPIQGTRTVTGQGAVQTVVLDGVTSGPVPVQVHIELTGRLDASGGVSLDGGGGVVSVGVAGAPPAWQGQVTHLQGETVTADLAGAGGQHVGFIGQLVVDRVAQTVGGTVHLAADPASGTGGH